MLRVWAQTGMRAGELAGLRWGDLDLDKGTVTVQRTYSRGRIGPTKTRQSRSVSLLHPVPEETAHWKPGATIESRAVLLSLRRLPVQATDPEAYVFVWQDGGPWHPMAVLRAFKRALRAAGVRYRSPEQLRHTFASTMLSRNAPLLYVQRQGGWKSASVLLRVYARWMPQEFAADVAQSVHPSAPQPHPTLDMAAIK
jgi:integrase